MLAEIGHHQSNDAAPSQHALGLAEKKSGALRRKMLERVRGVDYIRRFARERPRSVEVEVGHVFGPVRAAYETRSVQQSQEPREADELRVKRAVVVAPARGSHEAAADIEQDSSHHRSADVRCIGRRLCSSFLALCSLPADEACLRTTLRTREPRGHVFSSPGTAMTRRGVDQVALDSEGRVVYVAGP